MRELKQAEKRIEELQQASVAKQSVEFLRQLKNAHERKLKALETETIQSKQIIESLNLVLAMSENGGALPLIRTSEAARFAGLSAWECAEIVLEKRSAELSAREIAEEVQTRGKDLGTQSTASITNGLKAYLGDKFYRLKPNGEFVYGLMRWKEEAELVQKTRG